MIEDPEVAFLKKQEELFPMYNFFRAETSSEITGFPKGLGLKHARILYTGKINSTFDNGLWKSNTYLMLIPKWVSMVTLSNAMPSGQSEISQDMQTQTLWEHEYLESRVV